MRIQMSSQLRKLGRKKLHFLAILPLVLFALNWLYNDFDQYQKRARLSEMKIALAAADGAQRSYYSEYSEFSSSFEKLGLTRHPGSQFVIGFPEACWKKWKISEKEAFYVSPGNIDPEVKKEILKAFQTYMKPGQCPDLTSAFELIALRKPDKNSPIEIWRRSKHGSGDWERLEVAGAQSKI